MSLAAAGITAEVIREVMPPYFLSPDLLIATLAALPPPPRDASEAWRLARITRLVQEVSALMPANAAQARMAARILTVRELADTLTARAYAPELTDLQMCRVAHAASEVERTATGLVRTLERAQQKPAPFFGTVLADGVDVAALNAVWGKGAAASAALRPDRPRGEDAPGAEPEGDAAPGERGEATGHEPTHAMPDAAPVAGDADRSRVGTPMPVSEGEATAAPADRSAEAAARATPLPGSTAEGVVTRLSEGPGWTLDVSRPRASVEAGSGAAAGGGAAAGAPT
jgi:hypothetical protein